MKSHESRSLITVARNAGRSLSTVFQTRARLTLSRHQLEVTLYDAKRWLSFRCRLTDPQVKMNQQVSHPSDLSPGNLGIGGAKIGTEI
jgi:hypothetical protein